jgi:AraC-like DNA-binding protein
MKQSTGLHAARAFIEAHFDEPVTLAQLAALSALSVSRFATVFRQQYGSSPYRYLCGLRIQRAQTLLLEGVPGSVVATEVGFFDQSHFGRHFKRCCGMTPSMFIQYAATALQVTPDTVGCTRPTLQPDLPHASGLGTHHSLRSIGSREHQRVDQRRD